MCVYVSMRVGEFVFVNKYKCVWSEGECVCVKCMWYVGAVL